MAASAVHQCECVHCRQPLPHPEQARHAQMNLFLSRLDEQQRRWYVALEADRLGHGGEHLLAQITGLDEKTIRRGRAELAAGLADRPTERVRLPGGGRPPVEKKDPEIGPALEALVEPETAGDPQSEQKWVRSSLRHLSRCLGGVGHPASPPTVGRLLRDRDYSLRVNSKQEVGKEDPDRAEQFRYLEAQKQAFLAAGKPVISVDTKKKELIGNFANAGAAWRQGPERVNVHDFRQEAVGRAVPYGIYDPRHNRGSVYVGEAADTPRFAVEAIVAWWHDEGEAAYRGAQELLVLADGGGSNGCQPRAWKGQLQEQLADRLGLVVTVCHYPTGCSKWNPVEHRLFGPISINWAGQPLRTFERLVGLIRGTTTRGGLTVRAERLPGQYPTGETLTDAEMKRLQLERHATCPRWNYTIRPRQTIAAAA